MGQKRRWISCLVLVAFICTIMNLPVLAEEVQKGTQAVRDTAQQIFAEAVEPQATTEQAMEPAEQEPEAAVLEVAATDFTVRIINDTECGISGYTGDAASVVIPEEIDGRIVRQIDNGAFRDNLVVQQIILPESIDLIDSWAFSGCTGLSEISLPEGLKTIYYAAFENCDSLTSVVLPNSVATLTGGAFRNCDRLSEVTLPVGWNSVGSTGESPFVGCASLTKMTIPEGMTVIPKQAFNNMQSLQEVVFADSVESIGTSAFNGCSNLQELNLNNSCKVIDSYAFIGCSNLQEVTLPDTMEILNTEAFKNCTGLKSVTLNEGLQKIGSGAFRDCSGLSNVSIPSTVDLIDSWAFSGCTGLTEISLLEGLKTIYYAAFENCDSLTSVVLPDSVATLTGGAFRNCDLLSEVTLPVGWNSVGSTGESPFVGCASLTKMTIPEGMTVIPKQAFNNMQSLQEVVFADSVESIGTSAFNGCSNLQELNLNNSCKVIDSYAFIGCSNLQEVTLPDTMEILNTEAFKNCTGLKSVTLNEGLQKIGSGAFRDCSGLSNVSIPSTVDLIDSWAFSGCTGLTEISLLEGLKTIYYAAFENCDSLTSVVLPDSVATLTGGAFRNCDLLSEVTLPVGWNSVGSTGESPFVGCSSLTKMTIPEGMTVIPNRAFSNMKSLQNVVFADSVERVGDFAFSGCSNLQELNLNTGCRTIGSYVFSGCTGLQEVTLPDFVQTIAGNAFEHCSNLIAITIPKSVTSMGNNIFYDCPKLIIYCYSGSVAHTTAESSGYTYVLLDDHEHQYELVKETAPTCTKAGAKEFVCTICDYPHVEVIEALGHEYETKVVEGSCTADGYTLYTCTVCGYNYRENYTEAPGHQFGDWITEREASIFEDGLNYRECSVCGTRETETIPKKEIDINTNENYGLAELSIVDATTLEPVKHAQVYVFTETDGDATLTTDENGKISVILPVGAQHLSIVADGYLARNIIVSITSGVQALPQIGLTDKPMIEGILTSTEMTYDEIVAAGIDVTNPNNNHVYKYEVKMSFRPELDVLSIMTYFNSSGEYLGFSNPNEDYIFPPNEDDVTNSSTPGYAGGGWYYHSDTGSGNGRGNGIPQTLSDGTAVTIYPVSEKFYLIIYGEVHWLKEMYDVELLVLNHSQTDTVENCVAELTLPAGLSLAEMNEDVGPQSLVQNIDFIDKGSSESVHWYIRGDEAGSYDISAKLSGQMMPFEEPFEYEYTASGPIKVYAGNAMHMTIETPTVAYYNEDYPVYITLTNVSDKPIYGLTHTITGLQQCRATYYSDGSEEKEVYVNTGELGSLSTDVFNPGDKMVVELVTNIKFHSELVDYQLRHLMETIDQVEQLTKTQDSIKCFSTGAGLINALDGFLNNASSNLDKVVNSGSLPELDENKKDACRELSTAVSKLMRKVNNSDSEALDTVNKLQNLGVYEDILKIADDENFYKAHTAAEIMDLANIITASAKESSGGDNFNIYDAFRNLAQALPVKFVLEGVTVTTMEGSTTSIPYTIKTVDNSHIQYFGVDNFGKYLYEATISMIGPISPSFYFDILGKNNDPTGYGDAIEYIKAVDHEVQRVAAQSATGKTTFKAWIEPAQTTRGLRSNMADSFELFSDNETATYENGVLTFTGAGFIELKPIANQDGVLHIEMEEDGVVKTATYEIEMVEPHTCHSDTWVSALEPTADTVGYMAKCCDICDDIIDVKEVTLCTAHQYGEWMVDTEPTADESGIQARSCRICGHTEYELLAPMTTGAVSGTVTSYGADDTITLELTNGTDTYTTTTVGGNQTAAEFVFTNTIPAGGYTLTVKKAGHADYTETITVGTEPLIKEVMMYLLNDVNGDGAITAADMQRIYTHMNGSDLLTGEFLPIADANGDGAITAADMQWIYAAMNNKL